MKPWILKRMVPIPKLDSGTVYVFVGPHPDDIEIGCGATAAKLVRLGKTVMFVVVTDGGAGSKDPSCDVESLLNRRRLEASQSASLIGATLTMLDYPDGGRYDAVQLAEDLALLFVRWNADFVFGPDPDLPSEIHPDHKKTGQAIKEAVFLSANPLALVRRGYSNVSARPASLAFYYTAKPNRGWSVSRRDVELQQKAIEHHPSQFPKDAEETKQLFLYLHLQKRMKGLRYGALHADSFRVLGSAHQHCFPEVERY